MGRKYEVIIRVVLVLAVALFLSFARAANVMIIDTKADLSHKEFSGYNVTPIQDGTSKCHKRDSVCLNHGTHILSVILKGNDLIDPVTTKHKFFVCDVFNGIKCLNAAINLKIDVINYSGGGYNKLPEEESLMQMLVKAGVVVFASTGNDGVDIKKSPFYPASYAGVRAVASVNSAGNYSKWSNTGTNMKYPGEQVYGALRGNRYGMLSGTSQATALATHYYLKSLDK